MLCPLCESCSPQTYYRQLDPKGPQQGRVKREFYQCGRCQLVFVPAMFHLSAAAEKAEYDKHQNSPQDSGYRRFLARTLDPLSERLAPGASGLDFGCGPGPTLSVMLAEQGLKVANYDLYYYPDASLLAQPYDFITLTEVIEHLASPMQVLTQLARCLRPNSLLAVMTKRVESQNAFAQWHYKNDPTHIAFYSEATFTWIAEYFSWQLEIIAKDVVFFRPINR